MAGKNRYQYKSWHAAPKPATRCPFALETISVLRVCHGLYVERLLHKRFQASRIQGEWFSLTEGEVEAFCTIAEEQVVRPSSGGQRPTRHTALTSAQDRDPESGWGLEQTEQALGEAKTCRLLAIRGLRSLSIVSTTTSPTRICPAQQRRQ